MHDLLLRTALLVVLGGAAFHVAHADVFTWTDTSGRVNISNLDPPAGAHVIGIVHVNPPNVTAAADAAREALRQAEVTALEERVKQLQDEVEAARRPAPQPMFRVVAPPSAPYAGGNWAPEASPYEYAASPAPEPGCGPSWADCPLSWGPGFSSVIILRAPAFHHFHASRGHRPFTPRSPVRSRGAGRMH